MHYTSDVKEDPVDLLHINTTCQVLKWICVKVLVIQSCPTFCDPMDCNPLGSSVHEIFQAKMLEWVAIPFSKRSSQPRDQTCLPHHRQILYHLSHQGFFEIGMCSGVDTTKRLHFHFSLSCIGEGNGNPLQCSCLENPRDGGAWRADVYGVAESDTTEVT